jgi:hypothetical protein
MWRLFPVFGVMVFLFAMHYYIAQHNGGSCNEVEVYVIAGITGALAFVIGKSLG